MEKKIRCYPLRLLFDQGGFWNFIVPIALTLFSTASSHYQQSQQIKAGKHAQERAMSLEVQTREAMEKADLAKLQEITEQERLKLEQMKHSGFQTGRYSGPLFQAVRK